MTKRRSTQIVINVEPEIHRLFLEEAEHQEVSSSSLGRLIVLKYLLTRNRIGKQTMVDLIVGQDLQ